MLVVTIALNTESDARHERYLQLFKQCNEGGRERKWTAKLTPSSKLENECRVKGGVFTAVYSQLAAIAHVLFPVRGRDPPH